VAQTSSAVAVKTRAVNINNAPNLTIFPQLSLFYGLGSMKDFWLAHDGLPRLGRISLLLFLVTFPPKKIAGVVRGEGLENKK
jgi:hypothetical protein